MNGPDATRSSSSTTTSAHAWIKRRLTEIEAAEVLHVSPRTLQTWRIKGGGPPFKKFGAAVRYDPDTLVAWDRDQTRNNTSDRGPLPANQIPVRVGGEP